MSYRKAANSQKGTANAYYRDATAGPPRQSSDNQQNNENRRMNPTVNTNDTYLQHSGSPLSFNNNLGSRRNAGPPGKVGDYLRHAGGDVPLSQTNIYIRGLPSDFTANDLDNLCSKFGRVVSTKAVLDPDSGRCRGYGFIDFESPQAAAEALTSINAEGKYEVEMAKDIRARPHKHLEQDPTNLYIANLPPEYTEHSIRNLFNRYGMVISTRVLRNADMTSRCVGFARMDNKESCDQIIAEFNGQKLDENCDPLVVKLADSGTRRPKHSTSSSGQSSDQTMCSSTWSGAQSSRYGYSTANYNDQSVSFSPVVPNGSYPIYDPNSFPPSMTGVSNVQTAMPLAMPYSNLVYQTNRQLSMGSPATNSGVSNPVVYQTPYQQVDYYGKPIYKPQSYVPSSYYQPYSAYPTEFMSPQTYSAMISTPRGPVVTEDECYATYPEATPVYFQNAYYPYVSQDPRQMALSSLSPNRTYDVPSNLLQPESLSDEREEENADEERKRSKAGDRRAVSVEQTAKTYQETDESLVRAASSDTRLNSYPASS